MGQGGGAEHQAEHHAPENCCGARPRLPAVAPGKGCACGSGGRGPCQVGVAPFEPQRAGVVDRVGIRGQRALGLAHLGQRGVARPRCVQLALGIAACPLPTMRAGPPRAPRSRRRGAGTRRALALRAGRSPVRLRARSAWAAATPYATCGIGLSACLTDSHMVGIRNATRMMMYCATWVQVMRAHAAQERADQDAGQAQENPDRKIDAGKARGDQADGVDLRHDVGERDDDGGADGQRAHRRRRVRRRRRRSAPPESRASCTGANLRR